jgi:hypothetical protein
MNNEIRESIDRLKEIKAADMSGADHELATLQSLLRKEIERQTNVVNTADSTDPIYRAASSDLVGLLQLGEAVADSREELTRLTLSAGKAVARVTKKAPK